MSIYTDYEYDGNEVSNTLDADALIKSMERTKKDTPIKHEKQFKRSLDKGESNEADVYSEDTPLAPLEALDSVVTLPSKESEIVLEHSKNNDPKDEYIHASSEDTQANLEDFRQRSIEFENKLEPTYFPEVSIIDFELLQRLQDSLKPFNKDFYSFFNFIYELTSQLYSSTTLYDPRMTRPLVQLATNALLYEKPENYLYLVEREIYHCDPLFRGKSVVELIITKANERFT